MTGFQTLAVLLTLTVAVYGQQPSIELQVTESHVRPGREVTLTCRVTNKGDSPVHLTKWYTKDDGTLHTDILTSNTALIVQIPRYSLTKIPVGDVQLFTLVISNTTFEDSGNFGCILADDPDVRGIVELFVYHPVSELTFSNFTAGQEVTLNETSEVDLVCNASGSIPAASMRVTLDSEDITSKFTKTTHSTAHCTSGSITSKPCTVHPTHSVVAIMDGWKPTWKDHMKRISCTANVENSGFDARELSFLLDVQYPPKFVPGECEGIVSVRLGRAYDIKCKISSNPSNPLVYWSFMWGGKQVILPKDGSTEDGEFTASQTKNADGIILAKLHVKNLNSRHLTTFNLNANNTLGSNETTIKLQEDNSNINGGVSISSTSIVIFPVYLLLKNLL